MNRLEMDLQESILTLTAKGWSQRKIARELQIDRETVARYRRLAKAGEAAKPANPPAGSDPASLEQPPESKPAISPAGRRSECEPFQEVIKAKLAKELSAQRIYQDLVAEHGFGAGYDSVKRFVSKLEQAGPVPFRRMECAAGEEAQLDFGLGAWVCQAGKRRRPYVLRVILSYSRKGYAEVFYGQTTENFIRGLENAFRHFGGVPVKLVPDNLRAAVKKADWFDPELNPKIISFCQHYGCVMLPAKPGMARHKGKVEAGVKYVQSNALARREFSSLAQQNQFLAQWEKDVADTRIHGTTRQQVRLLFETQEKPALRPLPANVFPVFSEAPRKVHRDGYVEVAKAYYSAPPEYVGRSVWARWDTALVRIYNLDMKLLAVHPRRQPGAFETLDEHIHSRKRCVIERGLDYLLQRCGRLGPQVARWAQAMYQNRGLEGLRVLQGLLHLAQTYSPKQLNQACAAAVEQSAWRLRQLKALLPSPQAQQQSLDLLQEHPLIRPLSLYQQLLPNDCFAAEEAAVTNQTNTAENTLL
jgi:transposase